ncbi:MAG: zinc dependent phospholipase C family protein [Desulfobulbaceae bacterium]|nr:zinc dependent phospholipase C family protein [Desulfobulbaceae bacterium]
MSLTHGHYYIADAVRAKLSAGLNGVIENNFNAYLLGSVGPDILYWADYGKWPCGEYELVLGCDPHVAGSGDMIVALVQEYIRKRRLSHSAEEQLLAFLLGWITHWSADLYIHTLVDKYGGIYGSATPRHIQLELVETRHIQTIKPAINAWRLEHNPAISSFLADAVTRAYPDARIKPHLPGHLRNPAEPARTVTENRLEFLRFAHTGYAMISWGWEGTNPAFKDTGPIMPDWGTPARTAWAQQGASTPSQAVYEELLDPLKVQTVQPTLASVDIDIKVLDTGLYGKFIKDYQAFADGAIFRATAVMELVEELLNGLFPSFDNSSPFLRNNPPDWETPVMPLLHAAVKEQGNNIDILRPETQIGNIDQEIVKIFNDKTIRDQYDRKTLYYELTYTLAGKEPELIFGYEKIETTGTNGLLGSHAGTVKCSIPITNPHNLAYTYQLSVSLTDKEAFGHPLYEQVEHKDCGQGFFDGDLMAKLKKCNRIRVIYTGPLKFGSSREGSPMAFTEGNTTFRSPFPMGPMRNPRVVEVDLRQNGRNHQEVAILWSGNSFRAVLAANETYMEMLMPGTTSPPKVAGGSKKSVSIRGTIDPVSRILSVEADETFTNAMQMQDDDDGRNTRMSTNTFSAAGLPFQGMTEDGDLVNFGVDTLADLERCSASYRSADAATGSILGSNRDNTEELLLKKDSEDNAGFIVEFSVEP